MTNLRASKWGEGQGGGNKVLLQTVSDYKWQELRNTMVIKGGLKHPIEVNQRIIFRLSFLQKGVVTSYS